MTKSPILHDVLPRLYERDIDVVLQEELLFNEHVRDLFEKSLKLNGGLQVDRCSLSVFDSHGETDVLASFTYGKSKGILLIENKIDAAFQARQPERYKQRAAEIYSKTGESVFTVLVAPDAYLRSTEEVFANFDAMVSYEDLAAAIVSSETPRAKHRGELIRRAVQQAKASYVLVPAAEVTAFWRRVFEIADRQFPDLQMPRPGEKGNGSNWIIFKADLPANITVDWKVTKAAVDLSFWKSANHKPVEFIDLTDLGGIRGQAGETILIRIPVSAPAYKWVDVTDEQIQEALTAATKLLQFYRSNPRSFA